MKDISMIRIFRYALAVFFVLTIAAYSNPANAETGNLVIDARTTSSYNQSIITTTACCYFNMSRIYLDYQNYTGISSIEIQFPPDVTWSNNSNSSAFTIVSNGTGSGYASYNKNTSRFTLFFSSSSSITNSPALLSWDKAIYENIVFPIGGLQNDMPVNLTYPVTFGSITNQFKSAGCLNTYSCRFVTSTITYIVNSYNVTYSSVDAGILANVYISKQDASANTKIIMSNQTETIFQEPDFNRISFNSSFLYNTGLTIAMYDSAGDSDIVLVNSTGITPPPGQGEGGSLYGQISYNFASASVGQTYGVNASISASNFSALNTYYIHAYDTSNNLINGFPISFNTQTYNSSKFWTFNRSGTYTANLSYCGFLDLLCQNGITSRTFLDSATVYIPPPTYNFSVTTDAANYQPGNTINIVATNPSPNPAYLTAFGETGVITDIAWNTLIPAGQSVGLSRVIPQNMPLGTYTLNLATTQSYYPIVAQAVFNISSPGNTTNTLSALWGESLYLLGNVGTVTTTSNWNASTLTITSPGGTATTYSFPANSTNYTLITLNEVGNWNAKIVDDNNASVFSQSNTTVTAGNPTDNQTVELCMSANNYICWDKRQYTQGQAYVISFQLKPKPIDILSYVPYIEIVNPSGTVIYNQSVNGTLDETSFMYVGSLSGNFDPQASTGLYFARLKTKSALGEINIRAESAAEVVAGATPTTTEGQVSTTTATNLLNVLGMIAFYGLVIYVGLLYGLIRLMTMNGAQINGSGFIYAAVILANIVALIGLFDPFKMYVLVLTWIIAGATFTMGRRAVSGGD